MVAHGNRKTRTTQANISVKNSENYCLKAKPYGNIFSELSLRDLGEKNYLGGLEMRTKEKTEQTA